MAGGSQSGNSAVWQVAFRRLFRSAVTALGAVSLKRTGPFRGRLGSVLATAAVSCTTIKDRSREAAI